jgi:hypothetical protein
MRHETRARAIAIAADSPLQFRIVARGPGRRRDFQGWWLPLWQLVVAGDRAPYVPGTTTDVGAAVIYSLVFLALLLVDAGRFSVDRLIIRRVPAWRRISDSVHPTAP